MKAFSLRRDNRCFLCTLALIAAMNATDFPSFPPLLWTENGTAHSVRWRSESGTPPPKRVMVADDTLNADAVTASPQNAQSLVDVMKFFVSMIGNNQNAPSGVASIANSAQFSVNGSTAHISMLLPEAQVEQLLMPQAGSARTPKKPRPVQK